MLSRTSVAGRTPLRAITPPLGLAIMLLGMLVRTGWCLSKDDFVELVRSHEAQMSDVELDVTLRRHFNSRYVADPSADAEEGVVRVRTILAGPPGGKYRQEVKGAVPSAAKGKLVMDDGIDKRLAFDGERATEIRFRTSGPKTGRPADQSIWGDRRTFNFDAFRTESCMNLVPKYFEGVGLSNILADREDWDFERLNDNVYLVRCRPGDPDEPGTWHMTIDFARGGLVTHLSFVINDKTVLEYKDVVWEQSNGEWSLKSCALSGSMMRAQATVTTWKVNQNIGDDVFVLDFVPGFRVTDYVTGASWTHGVNPDTLDSLVEETLDDALEMIDEPTPESAVAPTAAGRADQEGPLGAERALWWYLFGAAAVVVAIAACVVLVRRKRPPAAPILLLVGLLFTAGSSAGALASENAAPESETFYEFTVGGKSMAVHQCGVYAALVALKRFEIEAKTADLQTALHCTRSGATMLRLRDALRAYGLDANGMKNVTPSQLQQNLASGGLAVVVGSLPNGGNHFIPFVGMKGRSFIGVGFPEGVVEFSPDSVRSILTEGSGRCVMVRGLADEVPSDALAVDQPNVELGDIRPSKKPITTTVSLRNTADRGILITHLRASCGGCLKCKVAKTWLEPAESTVMTCEVNPLKWGRGKSKFVDIRLADGNRRSVSFSAISYDQRLDRIRVSCSHIQVTSRDFAVSESEAVERYVTLSWVGHPSPRITRIETQAPWLQVSREAGSSDSRVATLKVSIREAKPNEPTETKINCYLEDLSQAIVISVNQVHEIPFVLSPPIAFLPLDGKSVSIAIRPYPYLHAYRTKSLSALPDYIKAEYDNSETTGSSTIVLSVTDPREAAKHCDEPAKLVADIVSSDREYSVCLFYQVVIQPGA